MTFFLFSPPPQDSDFYARADSRNMPDFRSALREKIKHTRDELPTGLMREVNKHFGLSCQIKVSVSNQGPKGP